MVVELPLLPPVALEVLVPLLPLEVSGVTDAMYPFFYWKPYFQCSLLPLLPLVARTLDENGTNASNGHFAANTSIATGTRSGWRQ